MNYQFRIVYTSKKRQAGVTLIELMISLTIGLILVAAVGYVYVGSRQSFRTQEALSRMQENARYAFDVIGKDIRLAGFGGCSYSTFANVLNDPSGSPAYEKYLNFFNRPIIGYDNSAPSDITNRVRGDTLSMMRAEDREYIVDSHNPSAAQLQLTANHDIKQGEILLITDCSHAALFQMTNVNNNNTIKTIVHNTGNAATPGNCTKGLGLPVPNPCDTNGAPHTFPPGSRIFRLSGYTYYIRANVDDEPALYRQRLSHSGSTAGVDSDELLQGVEDMQISYGVDTTGTQDGTIDSYVTANNVPDLDANGAADWERVLGVRVRLLMVSQQNQNITTKPQRYTLDKNGDGDVSDADEIVTPNDRLLRKIFTATFAVRNRL